MSNQDHPYIIAEVGQNHQGDVNEALRYISVFAGLGADAVKFQMRSNKYLFDDSFYSHSYDSENSFGDTYGQHRDYLELSFEEMLLLRARSRLHNVDFIVTPFDEPSLFNCQELEVDKLKIASFDLGNLPFLDLIGKSRIPVVMSTGGGNIQQIIDSVNSIKRYHSNISVLHCVSKYPCPPHEMQLNKIIKLKDLFPDLKIGISDHFNGILSGPIAYMLGARVFEKHVTFDRSLKGTDHPFSLEPDGFRKFVRDIKRTPQLLKLNEVCELGNEPVFKKLGKSIVAACDITSGTTIELHHLSGRIIRPSVTPVRASSSIIGRRAKADIPKGEYICVQEHLL